MGKQNLKPSRDAVKLQDAYNKGFKQGKFEERERIIGILKQPLLYFKTTRLYPNGIKTTSYLADPELVIALEQALKEGG